MRNLALILACCAACAVLVASAQAAAITVNGTVTAGSTLSLAGNGTPSFNLTLNGVDQTPTYTLPVSVIDARGLSVGGGWNLTVTSTQFNDGSGHTFPTTASTITGVTTGCGTNSTCTLPTNNVTNTNLALPAAAVAPAAVKFENAATATGLGTTNVNATVAVAVPANVFAGTYSSTVTVSIVAGP
jgi:putative surface cell wall-binding protein